MRLFVSIGTLFATAFTAFAGPDDVVEFSDPTVGYFILGQYQHDQLPDQPNDIDEITEAHMARLTKFIPHEFTAALFPATDFTSLEFAINLERIYLGGSLDAETFDLSGLSAFSALKELGLADVNLTALDAINSSPSLEILQLNFCHLRSVPKIDALQNLESLDLRNNLLDNIAELQFANELKSLRLSTNLLVDISPLAAQTQLEELYLGENLIDDLSALAGLTALQALDVNTNAFTDLTPVAGLTELTLLSLSSNSLTGGLSAVANLDKLTYLIATDCGIIDLSPLSNLPALTSLHLGYNEIADLTPIANSASLATVGMSNNRLLTLPAMDQMTALFQLNLGSNFLDATPTHPAAITIAALRARNVHVPDAGQFDPHALGIEHRLASVIRVALDKPIGFLSSADLAGLTVLDASAREITSLQGMEHAVNLEQLDVSENSIRDLSVLAGLTMLTHLDLASNHIRQLAPLAGLTSLTELNVASNGITDLTPLSGLTNLESLDLDGNGLDTAAGSPSADIIAQLEAGGTSVVANSQTWPIAIFADATVAATIIHDLGLEDKLLVTPDDLLPLRRLNLPQANISDLAGLEDAINLEELQLSNNLITDISPIGSLVNLKMLDISGNTGISDLSPLAALTELQYLDINGLPTDDIGALDQLTELEYLLIDIVDPAAIPVLGRVLQRGATAYQGIAIRPPEPGELAMTKFHYRPPSPTVDEENAGFEQRSDFEYIVIKNLTTSTLDLRDMEFSDGVELDFFTESIYQTVPPGFEIAVVGNLDAFTMRYGSDIRFRAAGEYDGKLADQGEDVELFREGLGDIRRMAYNRGSESWPGDVRGEVPLVLIGQDPARVEDGLSKFWRVLQSPIGVFESDVYTYDQFIGEAFALIDVPAEALEPDFDFDGDGSSNVEEYAFGTSPTDPKENEASQVDFGFHRDPASNQIHMEIGHFRHPRADEAIITPEISSDLKNWRFNPIELQLEMSPLPTTDGEGGAGYWRYRTRSHISAGRDEFLRFSVRLVGQ